MSHAPKSQSHSGPNPKRLQPQPKIKQTVAPAERLKTIVRRLPPNLPEEKFWQSVSPWVTNETVTWKIFYQGKLRKKLNRESVPSRAYIAFKTVEQVAVFSQQYDGHMFRDKQGNESFAIVEFAPYQKVPSEKRKADNRTGTVQEDDDYISFVESLSKAANAEETINPDNIESTALQPIDDTERSTPLLEALKAEKEASKDAANIIRYHSHYGAQSKSGPSGSRAKDRAHKEDDSTFSRSNEPNSPVVKAKDSKTATSSKDAVSGDGPASSNAPKLSKKQAQKAKNLASSEAQPNQNTAPRANKSNKQLPNTATSTPRQTKPDRSTPRPVHDLAEPSGSTLVDDGSSTPVPPKDPGVQRERKRPAGNQRMFEAAVAGAMGSTPAERRPRAERQEEGEKDKEQAVRGNREKVAGGNRGGRHPPQPRAILTRDSAAAPTPSSNLSVDPSTLQSDASNGRSFVSGQPQPPQGRSEVRREVIPAEPSIAPEKVAGPQAGASGNNGHINPPNPRGRRGRGFRGGPFGRGRGGAVLESNHERRVDTG